MTLTRLLPLDWRRRAHRRQAVGALADFYEHAFVGASTLSRSVTYVSLDLETTGLDPRADDILSVGLVPVREHAVHLEAMHYWPVRPRQAIPETSAVIHGILDDEAQGGEPLTDVLPRLLQHLRGTVLLAHHATVELGFIDRACRSILGGGFCMPHVDTLQLARNRAERTHAALAPDALRLSNIRQQYGLPHYRAHHAAIDALATAELFLAQLAHRGETGLKLAALQ